MERRTEARGGAGGGRPTDGDAGAGPGAPFALVARVEDVPEGTLLDVVTPSGERVCLANIDGEIRAMSNNCTHQDFPISDGVLHADGCVECAWHGAVFDTRTGAVKRFPATDPLPVYAVHVHGEDIYVGARRR